MKFLIGFPIGRNRRMSSHFVWCNTHKRSEKAIDNWGEREREKGNTSSVVKRRRC